MIAAIDTLNYDQTFIEFYQQHPNLHAINLPQRITLIANYFLGQPYQFEPLGEGQKGIYSILPLYRADQFDCVSFVDTILALAHARDFKQFKQNILSIRYSNQQIDYTQRTDWFTDLEWNPHAQQLGYVKDVTSSVLDQNQKPIAKYAKTIINKPAWYAQKILSNLDLPALPPEDTSQRLAQLREEGNKFTTQPSTLSYLPLTQLFNAEEQPEATVWDQFPPVAVVEIVRPNWRPVNPKDKSTDYGTNLNVAHMGIAIRTAAGIVFYHAATGKTVMSIPLADYLRPYLHDQRSPPVSGIHLEEIVESDNKLG